MDSAESSLTFREKCAATRAKAEMLKEERLLRQLNQGFLRTHLLPATVLPGIIFAFKVWTLDPLLAIYKKKAGSTQPGLGPAMNAFYAGDFGAAGAALEPILTNPLLSSQANILQARIHLAQSHPELAIASLREARKTALNRTEIDEWIHGLSAAPPEAKSQ